MPVPSFPIDPGGGNDRRLPPPPLPGDLDRRIDRLREWHGTMEDEGIPKRWGFNGLMLNDIREELSRIFSSVESCTAVVKALGDLGVLYATVYDVAEEAGQMAFKDELMAPIKQIPVHVAQAAEDVTELFVTVERMLLEQLNQCACTDGREAFRKDVMGNA